MKYALIAVVCALLFTIGAVVIIGNVEGYDFSHALDDSYGH